MASFTFLELPSEIAERIVSLVGLGGFRHLGPLVMAGKVSKDVAISTQVLKTLPLTDFLFQPNLTREEVITMKFFNRCVGASNPHAMYLEGIRLVCQLGLVTDDVRLIGSISPQEPHHVFALAIFLICAGKLELGLHLIREVEMRIPPFGELNLLADQFLEFVGEIRTRTEYGLVKIPPCLHV